MGVSYAEIIERMRWAGKLKNDSAVARVLGVTPQALSNYKKRGEMPTDLVLRFANIYGLSVDWLITGKGQMYRPVEYGDDEKRPARAAEETAMYGSAAAVSQRPPEIGSLTPDEIIYVGKLLKILRGPHKSAAAAIKSSVDAFLKASELLDEEEAESPKKEAQPT